MSASDPNSTRLFRFLQRVARREGTRVSDVQEKKLHFVEKTVRECNRPVEFSEERWDALRQKTLAHWRAEKNKPAKRFSNWAIWVPVEIAFVVLIVAISYFDDFEVIKTNIDQGSRNVNTYVCDNFGPIEQSANSFIIGKNKDALPQETKDVAEGVRLYDIRLLAGTQSMEKTTGTVETQGVNRVLETGRYIFNADENRPLTMKIGERVRSVVHPMGALTFVRYRGRLVPLVDGRADFSVRPGKEPVFVLTPKGAVEVVGTRFSIHVKRSEEWEKVSVQKGKVLYSDREKIFSIALTANDHATWSKGVDRPVVVRAPKEEKPISSTISEGRKNTQQHSVSVNTPSHRQGKGTEPSGHHPVHGKPSASRNADSSEANKENIAGGTPSHSTLEIPAIEMDIDGLPELSDGTTDSATHRGRESKNGKSPNGNWSQNLQTLPPLERYNVERFYEAIENFMKDGYTQRALDSLQEYIDDHSGFVNERAMFLVGECYKSLGDREKAIKAYRDYLKNYPKGSWRIHAELTISELK